MGYRILEVRQHKPDSFDSAREIAVHDSAYDAMKAMQQAFRERRTLPNWYLVDQCGHLIAGPDDIYEAVIA